MENITAVEVYKRVKSAPEHTFIIDIRTQAEYELVGHPAMAYNIPYEFWGPGGNKKNPHFVEDVFERFSYSDLLIILCRSGTRSAAACEDLAKTGFQNILDMSDGFEGLKVDNEESIYYGYRRHLNGWQYEGLPYTYEIDPNFSYQRSQ